MRFFAERVSVGELKGGNSADQTRNSKNMNTTENTNATTQSNQPSKAALMAALYAFTAQRSGIDWQNYGGSREAFMGDYRPILRNGKTARRLLRYVELCGSISAADIMAAANSAYSGRLAFVVKDDGAKVGVDYTTGQYFPTEYRRAVCAVAAAAIWAYWRASCMPEAEIAADGSRSYRGKSAGDYLRAMARREFGRGVAAVWFN